MPQPTLTTARIVLEPLADEHLEHEVELDSNPEVMRYLAEGARSRTETEAAHSAGAVPQRKSQGWGSGSASSVASSSAGGSSNRLTALTR